MAQFRYILTKILTDEEHIIQIFNSTDFPEFPEWTLLKNRFQTGEKTIAEHTLKMFNYLFKSETYRQLDDKYKLILKIAVLLHDIAKVKGGEPNHELKCAEMAKNILTRWGYEPDIVNYVFFLVKYHSYLGLISSKYGDYEPMLNELLAVLRKFDEHIVHLALLGLLNKVDIMSQFSKNTIQKVSITEKDRIDILTEWILLKLH